MIERAGPLDVSQWSRLPGEAALVVFREWIGSRVSIETSCVSTPPLRLLRLLESVIETLPQSARTPARRILLEIRRELVARLDAERRCTNGRSSSGPHPACRETAPRSDQERSVAAQRSDDGRRRTK